MGGYDLWDGYKNQWGSKFDLNLLSLSLSCGGDACEVVLCLLG